MSGLPTETSARAVISTRTDNNQVSMPISTDNVGLHFRWPSNKSAANSNRVGMLDTFQAENPAVLFHLAGINKQRRF